MTMHILHEHSKGLTQPRAPVSDGGLRIFYVVIFELHSSRSSDYVMKILLTPFEVPAIY